MYGAPWRGDRTMLAVYAFGALIGFEASFTRRSPWFMTILVAHLHTSVNVQ